MKILIHSLLISLFFTFNLYSQDNFIYDLDIIGPRSYELYENGQYTQALKEVDKIHFLDPNYVMAVNTRVEFMQGEEEYEEIIEYLTPLLEEGRFLESPHLFYRLAIAYNSLDKYEEAIKVLDEGIKTSPDFSLLYFYRSLAKYDFGTTQSAIEDIKTAITLNPNLYRAHYFLGYMALQKGEIVPGFLSLLGYLALQPDDEFASETVAMLDKNLASTYKDLSGLKFTREGDDFSELEEILRNNLPLNKKYKIESKLDYNYTRYLQAVLEYAENHEIKDGFFENQYISFLKEIAKQDHIKDFTYYTMVSIEKGKINKIVKKKFKDIVAFNESFILDDFQKIFFTVPQEIDGEKKNIAYAFDDGTPFLKGEVKNDLYEGDWYRLDEYGNSNAVFPFVEGGINGVATFYDDEGNITEKTTYKDDEKNGKSTGYNAAGDVIFEMNFKESKIDGEYMYSYLHGGKECIENYKDGVYNGKVECFYKNGNKSSELNYKDGERDGLVVYYYLNGNKSYEYMYKEGEINGNVKTYALDGTLINDYEMEDGDYVYPFKLYNNTGEIIEEGLIEDGNKKLITYDSDGSHDVFYYEKEEVVKVETYKENKLLYDYTVKNESINGITSYVKGVPKKLKGNSISFYDEDGNKASDRSYNKKYKLDGKSTYYYANGQISLKNEFENGIKTGKEIAYEHNGDLSSVSYIKNDTLHGLFKNYNDGFLSYTCYYNKGLLNGPLTFYRPDGSVSQVRMFYNGYPHKEITYDRAGNKNYEGNYLESVVSDFYMYENGEKIDSVDLKYFTGNTKYRVRGLESIEREVKNAVSNGKYFLRYSDGFTEIEKNFINDDLHGEYIFNAPTGEYLFKQSYVYGNKDGKAEWFTPNGVITYRCYYKNDEQNGKSTRFYANGNAYRTANHKNDKQQGNKIFYSPTGDTLLIMNMKDDLITSYQSRNDQGNLGETVVCGNGKEALSIKYENGKPALNIIINKKYIDGKLEIFSREGQLLVEKNRKNGHLDGIHSLYYDNGKMLFERIYKQNQLEGISLYFNENGEKEVEIESEMDMNHGSYKIYENGKLKKTLTYEADTCIAIE